MKNQSVTIIGLVVSLLAFGFPYLGLEVSAAELTDTVTKVAEVAGILLAWYGRMRIGDINLIGRKK